MKEDIKQAFNNITTAVEQYRGTKAEHIALEQSLQMIKSELETIKCDCKGLTKDGIND